MIRDLSYKTTAGNVRRSVTEMRKMPKQYRQICLDLVKAIPMHMLVPRVMAGILLLKNQEVQIALGKKNNANQRDKVNQKGGDNE